MKITIAQLDPTVSDLAGNIKLMQKTLLIAHKNKADLIIFPELFIAGYPPRDLLDLPPFIRATQKATNEVLKISTKFKNLGILFGNIVQEKNHIYNTAILINNGKIIGRQHKTLLPTYDVFDEARYFTPASFIQPIPFKDEILGVSVCEDMWNNTDDVGLVRHYEMDPIDILTKKGATILINISASPFYINKDKLRYQIIKNYTKKYQIPFIYVNQVGGNDELIFDGKSMVVGKDGQLKEYLPGFEEKIITIDSKKLNKNLSFSPQDKVASVYQAISLGLKDYFQKTGYQKAVLGLSGGIDSAVTACLAVEALGKNNVLGITMPSMFSSKGSVSYSEKLAKKLGIKIKTIPIKKVYDSYLAELKPHFANKPFDTTEENIQARIRGNLLMSMSNKYGYLVLSTGNKSEMAVGYCTLYGDMSGGLSVISDVPKTLVYDLARYINRKKEIIPKETIKIAPSAELRPNQKDQDSLPPYNILDGILNLYIDYGLSTKEIAKHGYNLKTVQWVIGKINRNEYKRKQAAPGLKITLKAFGVGRRMPIAAKYDFLKY
jgi:NAD+ synthase (glutamine-hydrolysing)